MPYLDIEDTMLALALIASLLSPGVVPSSTSSRIQSITINQCALFLSSITSRIPDLHLYRLASLSRSEINKLPFHHRDIAEISQREITTSALPIWPPQKSSLSQAQYAYTGLFTSLVKFSDHHVEPRYRSRHLPTHPHNRAKCLAPKIIRNHSLRAGPRIPVKPRHP
jgi:hypothetical protein